MGGGIPPTASASSKELERYWFWFIRIKPLGAISPTSNHFISSSDKVSHSSVLEYVVGVPGACAACAWRSRWCRDWSGDSNANEQGILQAAEITFPLLFFRLSLFGFSWL